MSNDAWEFKDKDDWIYIENISKTKVLVPTNDGKVILEVKDEDKNEHLWEKGVPNNDGYFTLQNARGKFMTAISPRSLGIKGNSRMDNLLTIFFTYHLHVFLTHRSNKRRIFL